MKKNLIHLLKTMPLIIATLMLFGCADKAQDVYRHDFVIKHPLSGKPLVGIPYIITAPDGSVTKGKTDKDGLTAEAVSKEPGEFVLILQTGNDHE